MSGHDLTALAKALAEYDERLSTCPGNSPYLETRRRWSSGKCWVCGADKYGTCGRDNPWDVVRESRALVHAKATGSEGGAA